MIIDEFQREKYEKVLKKLAEQLAAAKETDEELLILETDLEVLKSLNGLALKCTADNGHNLWRKAAQNLKNKKGLEIVYIFEPEPKVFYKPKLFYKVEGIDEIPIGKRALEQRLSLAWRVMEVIDEVIRLSLPEKRWKLVSSS